MPKFIRNRNTPIALLAASLCASALLMPGCGKTDERAKAIREASEKLALVTSSGQRLSAVESTRFAHLRAVRDQVSPYAKDGASKSVGAVLIYSRATTALGLTVSQIASEQSNDAVNQGTVVRSMVDLYLETAASAKAAEGHDPKAELALIDAETKLLDGQIAAVKAGQDKLKAETADLSARAKAALAKSKVIRQQATEMRARAVGASATVGLDVETQIAATNRLADGADREAADLNAEVALREPSISMLQSQLDGLGSAKAQASTAKETVGKLSALMRDRAKTMRESQAKTAADIKKLADVLMAASNDGDDAAVRGQIEQVKRTSRPAPKADDESLQPDGTDPLRTALLNGTGPTSLKIAEGYLDDAIRMVRTLPPDAATGDKNAGKLAEASAVHARADLLSIRARNLESYATVLASLAKAEPALPEAGLYSAKLADVLKAATDGLVAAREAYGEAQTKFGSAPSGNAKERFEKLALSLEKLAKGDITADEVKIPRDGEIKDANDAKDTKGKDATPSTVDPAATAALDKYLAASKAGDVEAIKAMMSYTNDSEKRGAEAMLGLNAQMAKLDAACKSKFGKTFNEIFKAESATNPQLAMAAGMMGGMGGADAMAKVTSADFKAVAKSDTVVEFVHKSEATLSLGAVKADGVWKITLGAAMKGALSGPQAGMMMGVLRPLGEAFENAAADVNSGKIKDGKQLVNGIMAAVMGAMGMPGRPGGG